MTELHTFLYFHRRVNRFSLFCISLISHTDKNVVLHLKILLSRGSATIITYFLAEPYVQLAMCSTIILYVCVLCMKNYDNISRLILNISHTWQTRDDNSMSFLVIFRRPYTLIFVLCRRFKEDMPFLLHRREHDWGLRVGWPWKRWVVCVIKMWSTWEYRLKQCDTQ